MGLDVTTRFAALLRWLRAWWPPERRVVLAMDASTLGQRFTGLCLRGVERRGRRHDALRVCHTIDIPNYVACGEMV
jgi:hypothetical protein